MQSNRSKTWAVAVRTRGQPTPSRINGLCVTASGLKIDYDTLLRTTLEYARGQPTIAGDRRKAGDGPNNDQASEAARSRGFANERGCNVWY